jgi:DNA polymerase family B
MPWSQGIETVRRDNCLLVKNVVTTSLEKMLIEKVRLCMAVHCCYNSPGRSEQMQIATSRTSTRMTASHIIATVFKRATKHNDL